MLLAHLSEAYFLRLLSPEIVKKATYAATKEAKNKEFKGGFSSKFKLNEDRLRRVVADIVEMGNCFGQVRLRERALPPPPPLAPLTPPPAQFLSREDLTQIMSSLNQVREMLTIDSDNLLTVLEVALLANRTVTTHGAGSAKLLPSPSAPRPRSPASPSSSPPMQCTSHLKSA